VRLGVACTFNKEENNIVKKAKVLVMLDTTRPEREKLLVEETARHTKEAGADCRRMVEQGQLELGPEWQYVDPSDKLKTLAGRHDESVAEFLKAVFRGVRLPFINEYVDGDRPVVLVSVGTWLRTAAKLTESIERDYPERRERFVQILRYSLNLTIGVTPALYVLDEPNSPERWYSQGLTVFPNEDPTFGRCSIVLPNGDPSTIDEKLPNAIKRAVSWNQPEAVRLV